jgi:hypothetical protein
MFEVQLDGKVVDMILAWDLNDAAVYASRRYGSKAIVRRVAPDFNRKEA